MGFLKNSLIKSRSYVYCDEQTIEAAINRRAGSFSGPTSGPPRIPPPPPRASFNAAGYPLQPQYPNIIGGTSIASPSLRPVKDSSGQQPQQYSYQHNQPHSGSFEQQGLSGSAKGYQHHGHLNHHHTYGHQHLYSYQHPISGGHRGDYSGSEDTHYQLPGTPSALLMPNNKMMLTGSSTGSASKQARAASMHSHAHTQAHYPHHHLQQNQGPSGCDQHYSQEQYNSSTGSSATPQQPLPCRSMVCSGYRKPGSDRISGSGEPCSASPNTSESLASSGTTSGFGGSVTGSSSTTNAFSSPMTGSGNQGTGSSRLHTHRASTPAVVFTGVSTTTSSSTSGATPTATSGTSSGPRGRRPSRDYGMSLSSPVSVALVAV